MNDPWRVNQLMTIIQRNLNLIQRRARKTRSRDQVLNSRLLLDDGIDQGRLADVGYPNYIDVTIGTMLFNLSQQLINLMVLFGRDKQRIDWPQTSQISLLPQPVRQFAPPQRTRQYVFFIANQQDRIVIPHKAVQSRNQTAIKVKDIHDIND